MKPSGIDWIGDVPQSWNLLKLKYFSYLKGRIGWQGLTADEFTEEGPYLITGTDFENGRIQFDRSYHISEERYSQSPEIQLKKGDLLVTKDGTVGKIAYVDFLPGKASLNSHLLLIRPLFKKFDNRFLFWLLGSSVFNGYTEYAQDGTVMASLSQEKIGNFLAFFPPIKEQQAIADYLDKQCGKINEIILALEKQIEILKKYKKSLILETVTKGLNKFTAMKSSGVDWIGKIPEHWVTSKIKYCIGLIGSGTTPESGNPLFYEDGNYNWIQSGDLYQTDYIYSTDKKIALLAVKNNPALTYYEKDFVVVAMYGASVGNVSISKIDAYTNQACCVIKAKENDDIRYLFYYFKAAQDEMLLKAFGGTQPNISQIIIKNLNYLQIPVEEQKAISDYLDKQCGKIESILKDKQKQLEKINQHKKFLIYEYVTGKKRVKEIMNGD